MLAEYLNNEIWTRDKNVKKNMRQGPAPLIQKHSRSSYKIQLKENKKRVNTLLKNKECDW